ncbi:DUF7507 domain-containing protein, partial [Patiriisocius hiemis]|nr:hypothetical protein [Constantimarinum sp. W242]
DTVTYTLVVSNAGPDTANNVVVTDTPTNLTIQSVSGGGCTGFPCTIASIASGTPVNDVAITVTATIDGGGAFDNAASVSADEIDNNAANDTDNDGANAAAVADVSITKTLNDTSPYQTGDTITYDVVVTNNGPDTANNVMVTDTPFNITIVSVTGGGPGCVGFPGCNLGTIANGASVTLTVTATIDGPGAFTNMVSVSADEIDINIANNTDDGTDGNNNGTAAAVADVALTKTLNDTSPYQTGDTVTYDIVVTNNGPDTANNVVVADTPTNLTIVSVAGGGAGCLGFPGCNLGALANGASITLTVTATIDGPGNFINEATVSADEIDNNTTNNTDNGADGNNGGVAAGLADLVTVKTLTSGNPTPAETDTVTFTITVTNNGPDTANNISLNDVIPSGLTPTINNGNVSAGTYTSPTWSIPSLINGASATLTIEGTVDIGQDGNTITNNTTAASGDENDPSTAGDDLSESVVVTGCLDTDGDGTCDSVDPDPNDPCNDDGIIGDEDTSNPIWQAADCDGDGVTNGDEDTAGTEPYDPCDPTQAPGYTGYDITNPIWQAADCDGDGVTNINEVDPDGNGVVDAANATDPYDPCDFNNVLITETQTTAFLVGDCDGDGVTNGQEQIDGTDINDPCEYESINQDTTATTPAWDALDCDGDGVTNGQEVLDMTGPTDPCEYDPANQDVTIVTT